MVGILFYGVFSGFDGVNGVVLSSTPIKMVRILVRASVMIHTALVDAPV